MRILYSWTPAGLFKSLITGTFCFFAIISARTQNLALDGQANTPVRIATNPQNPILGGPQNPPYNQMATLLSNAFQSPDEDMTLIRDSSVCSVGIPETSDFNAVLVAVYQYENELLDEIRFTRIEDNAKRTPFSRKQFSYNNEMLDQYLYSRWDSDAMVWTPDVRELLQYDEDGRLTSLEMQQWSGSEWVNISRYQLSFTDLHRLNQITLFAWKDETWSPAHQVSAEYNNNALPLSVVNESHNGMSWDTVTRENYLYDTVSSFILEQYILERPDTITGVLQPVARETYSYDLRGFYSGRIVQRWDDVPGKWENVSRDAFTYTPIGIWKTWTQQIWQGGWQNFGFRNFGSSGAGQVDIQQLWNQVGAVWENDIRRFVQFDDYGNLVTERIGEVWQGDSEQWVNGPDALECRHFWSEGETSSVNRTEISNTDCQYINPYILESEIRCLGLDEHTRYRATLYDQIGRLMFRTAFIGGGKFTVGASLPAGLYYLIISDRTSVMYGGKMVITKNQ